MRRVVQNQGTYYLVGRGIIAELSVKTQADVEDWRARYNAATTSDERYAIAASVIVQCISTDNPGMDIPVPRERRCS